MFRAKVTSASSAAGTELTFSTTEDPPYEYREGLIGRFPVPSFTEDDVVAFLASGYLTYKLELNADFPVESIAANFARLAKGRPARGGGHVGEVMVGGSPVTFSYEVVPYRNGSKAVMDVILKPGKADNGVVDFAPMIDELKKSLAAVVNA